MSKRFSTTHKIKFFKAHVILILHRDEGMPYDFTQIHALIFKS